jgi:3-oxoacyl-[acyl-carrier-protein] synthase III
MIKPLKSRLTIKATGHYVPPKNVSNLDMEKIVETTDDWIYTRTGIKNRRFVEGEDTSDLAVKAIQDAIAKSGYDLNNVDLIIAATFTPDLKSPGVSNLVQKKLGLGDRLMTAFDINAACSGFVYALTVAATLMESGAYRAAIVVGAEVISKVTDFTDRNTCVLFGDGAGCVILEQTPDSPPAYFLPLSKGDPDMALYVDQFVHMDGQKVYQFAVRAIESAMTEIVAAAGLTFPDLAMVIPHQANRRIVQNASKNLAIPIEKFYLNIDAYGNTSAASIPIALSEAVERKAILPGQPLLFVAFGAGFTYGAAIVTL